MNQMPVPAAAANLRTIPPDAMVILHRQGGKVIGFTAMTDEAIWEGEAHYETGRGIVIYNNRPPMSPAEYRFLHVSNFM
jgi:hypothetical protein